MKVVVQRVKSASVRVGNQITGAIRTGLLLLVGIHEDDSEEQIKWMCDKILKLRIFEDEDQKMNLSVSDINGSILVVSQFTLYGNTSKGTRPSYIEVARPEKAEVFYNNMIQYLKEHSDLSVQEGKFGAMMDVALINDGPVTIILDK